MENKEPILSVLVLIAALCLLTAIYHFHGPQWELLSHYLNAQSLSHLSFHQQYYGNQYTMYRPEYFDTSVAPLPNFALALIIVSLGWLLNPATLIYVYLVILLLGIALVLHLLAKELKISRLVLYALVFNPIVISQMFVINSEDAMLIVFIFMALIYLYKKSPIAGLFLGLAALSKAPMIIFLPTILVLEDRKSISLAILLAVLVMAPILLFNFKLFGNPLENYSVMYTIAITNSSIQPIYFVTIASMVAFPLLFLAVAAFVFLTSEKEGKKGRGKTNAWYGKITLLLLLVVAFLLEVLIVAPWFTFDYTVLRNAAAIALFAILFLAMIVLAFASMGADGLKGRIRELRKIKIANSKLALLFLLIGLVAFIFIARHHAAADQLRYADMASIFLFLLCAMVINAWGGHAGQRIVFAVGLASLVTLVAASGIYLLLQTGYNSRIGQTAYANASSSLYNPRTASIYYNPDFNRSIFYTANRIIEDSPYGGCEVITNDWPYMLFVGMNAHDPYEGNYTLYPTAYFKQIGTANPAANLSEYSILYNSSALEVIIPANARCNP